MDRCKQHGHDFTTDKLYTSKCLECGEWALQLRIDEQEQIIAQLREQLAEVKRIAEAEPRDTAILKAIDKARGD